MAAPALMGAACVDAAVPMGGAEGACEMLGPPEPPRLPALDAPALMAVSAILPSASSSSSSSSSSSTTSFLSPASSSSAAAASSSASASAAAVGCGAGAAALSPGPASAPAPAPAGAAVESYYSAAHSLTERLLRQPALVSGGALKPYQLEGVEWLVSHYNNGLSCVLADEMGLGKTLQTIALLAHLMEAKGNNGPFLVCVPLSTLANWLAEFTRWAPAVRVVAYRGTPPERKAIAGAQMRRGAFNVLLTSYEFAMRDKRRLGATQWQYIIVDEGHRLKNAQSKFTRVLGHDYSSKLRLLLTGTPLQNSLPELWSLMNFLLPKIFDSSEDFEDWFNKPFASFSDRGAGAGGEDELEQQVQLSGEEKRVIIGRLHEILRPFLKRRVKAEVLTQLPEKVERTIHCDLSAWQRLQYRQIQAEGAVAADPALGGRQRWLHMGGNRAMHLRKAANHPFLFRAREGGGAGGPEPEVGEEIWRASGKLELLDRILPKLKACGHRVLIFSQMVRRRAELARPRARAIA